MFVMKEYPRDVLPLYAQGYSLARYLLDQGGKQKFLEFVGEGLQTDNWPAVTKKMYGFENLGELQNSWLAWVKQGSPHLVPANNEQVASNGSRQAHTESNPTYRAQGDDRARDAARRGNGSDSNPGQATTGSPNPNQGVSLAGAKSIYPTDLKVGPSIYERAMNGEQIELSEPSSNGAQTGTTKGQPAGEGTKLAARPQVLLEWSRTAQR
jgi:hypothetical protein